MFLSDDLKKVRDLRKSIIELENTPIQSEASKEMLRIKRLELKKFTDQGNYGANTLFDPKTGQYVSGNTKDPEIISFNKEMNKNVKTYENTDVGKLKKRRDDLYFQYQNFVHNVMLDQDISLNGLAREKYANIYGFTTPTDSQGLNAEFTKDQKKQIAIDMYGSPYNFHGWDLGGKGDMSDAFKIMNSDIFGDEVTMKAQLILADFMAVNRALKLNEDPAGIEDSKGFERFFTYAGKGFKEEMGGVSQADEVVAERTINQIKSLGYEIPLSQMESLKKDFTQELGEAAGASIPLMGEIMLDLALVNKVAGVAKIPKLIETLSRGNKVAKFGLDLVYEAASQGAAFEMAGEGFVGGAGEGVGQFLVNAALKKFKVDNRMLSILSKSVGGALSETAAEYTGQFVDELSKNNVGFDKAVERTFGKTPEDAMEKFALTYLISQIYGTGTSTVSTFTNPLNRGVDTEEQVSNEEWADWASKQVINFESDSPIVNEIKKFAEEQQAQLSPVQKTEIESIIEQQKQGPQKADIERIRQEELSILDAKQAESEKTGEIPTDENGNAINIKEEKQKINSKYDAALAVQEQDNINQQKQTTDEVQESQEGDVSTEEEVQKQDVEPTEEGKQEIINPSQVNPSEITQRNKEAEARLKKEGVDNLFIGANLPTGSNEKALPVSVDVINDIAVATYANEKTGLINTVISGFSENNFVGYYRIYENGKPTNKWSSKFENQNTGDKNIDSKKKDNFKTMISSVQERLPSDHLYTEKTSISTDGLRVWGNQIDRGTYEFALDEKGFYITNRVSINGDALVNELGIDVKQGDFQNIKVRTEKEFNKVKEALLPYLEKLRLNENNIYWTKPKGAARLAGSTVEIDLPVLKPVQTEVKPKVTTEEVGVYTTEDIVESTDAKAFAEAQSSALSQRTDTKLQVDPTSEQDAQKIIDEGGKLFLTSDGKAGAYVTADGYMGGLFKDPNSDKNQASKALQEVRTKAGGKFFDAFGINPETGDGTTLEEIYVKNGFRPVARMPFDPDMAPKGWENTTLASKPDNVFFVYDPDYKAKVGEGETITDFDKAYEMAKNYKPTSTSNSANKTVVEPGKRLFNEPNKETAQISKKYREEKGIEFDEGEPITELDEDLSKEIADAYEAMEDNPNDPEVKEAYDALALETVDQYKALMDAGYEVEIYKGEGEPYANSEEMIKDLKENKHIYIFSTEGGFGETGITDKQRSENAMLGSTEFKDVNGEPLLVNDLFRAVHDFFGHSERGNGFGAIGEENAWDVHARMFSDKARRAMTTETKGQNSWVNFGPQMRGKDGKILKKGDKGYLKPSERKFAEQKMGLLPEKYSEISSTKKEPTVSTEETFEVADDVIPEVTEGALSLLDAFGKKPKKSKVDPKKRKQVLDQVAKAEKALSKISPKTKIVVHETSKDYTESGRNRNQNEGGEYDIGTDTIHINMEAANERTVAHEVFHALLLSKGMGDKQAQAITNKMLDAVKKSASPELLVELEEFSKEYVLEDENGNPILDKNGNTIPDPVQSEESIAELFGILASEYDTLPRPTQNLIKRWLDKLAKLFGLKLFTDNEVVDMLNTVSKSVREGSVIEESDIDVIRRDPMPARDTRADFLGGIPIDELTDADLDQNQTRQWDREQKPLRRLQSNFSDAVSKLTFSYDKNSDRFDKLKKEGYITDGKSISDFDGKFFFFHQPDAAFSGQILKDGELLVEGKGGMYYPIKFHEDGYFWASTDRVAKKMADDLNKVMEQNGGKIYMALTSAPRSKLMSSTTMSNAVMDFFSSKSFDSNFNISEAQVKRSIVRAANNVKTVNGKKVGLNMSLSVKDSLSEIKSSVSEKLDPKKSSFKERKSFVEDLVGEMSREINKKDISIEQFGKFFSEGIQNKYFKGVTKTGKVKVSKANMIQALSEMMTEPILKDDISRESGGQIYAVLEMEGKVKPVKSDKHESYPMAIQSAEDKKTTLHILSDRVDWGDVTEDFETNEIVKPERRKKIYPTSGVSTRGLKINTKSVRRRKQKPSDDRPSIEAVREKAKELGVSEKDIYIALKKMGYTNAEIRSTEAKSIADAKEKYNTSVKRGSSKEQALKSAVGDLKSTYWYENASDTQRENAVRELRKELGAKEKKAPSKKKILGEPKEKKVTMTERSALKSQIRMEARAARGAVKSYKDASKDLIDHIKELSKSGVIKSSQASVMIKKVLGTNMLNEKAVKKMTDYIDKVYSNAELAAMIQAARKLSVTSKKNLRGKVGPSKSMQSVLENLFSLDPTMVPMDVFDTYVDLLNQFGERKAVLDLEESSVVLDKATKVLDSVEESIKETEISETDGTEISETDETTSNKEEVDFDKYAEDVLSEEISMDNLDSKEAKDLAEYLNKLTKKDVEALVIEKKDGSKSYAMLENLRGVKKNMTNGFVPSVALRIKTMVESKKSADKIKSVVESKVKNFNPLTMMSRGYGIIKGKLTGKRSMTESVRGNSVFSIDDILGNFNDKSIYNNTFRKLSTAYSSYQTDMEINVKSKLDAAEKLLHKKNKFFQKLENKVQESKYKLQAYRLQREFESNPESSQVVPAVDFINETIRVIKKDKAGTTLNKNDIRILEKIKEDFGTDGQIDLEKIEKSMTANEKKALKLIDEASDLQSKALWTSAVIRGEKIKPINNYVHHNVKTDSDAETVIEKAKGIMNPSTKAGTLNTRTPGVKAINFDPISSTEMGARQTLLDYHMTESVREVSSTLSQLQKMDYNTDTQQEAINAIDNTVRELLEATLNSQLANTSILDKGLAKIKKLGYQASLGSIPRAALELGSNLMYAITKPKQFVEGVKEFGRFSIGSRGIEAMNNLGSSETMRLYDTHNLTGKMIDSGVLETGARKTTKTRSEIEDKIRYLDNLGPKQVRGLATTVADALVSTPDKAVSRPMWFGTFALEFKKLTGETISSKEMDKIADGTSKYLDPKYNESVKEAAKVADRELIKMSNTNNPFNSTPKNLPNAADSALKTIYKSANSYMASFQLNEFGTARNAVLSSFQKGDMTKGQAAAALTGIQMRMASYMIMYSLATGLFDSMFGVEEEEKDTLDLIKRQMLGAPISLITGRSLGNIPKIPINYAIEQFNEEYLEGLRSGEEYDPYKHSLVFSQISENDISKKSPEELAIKMFAGPYSPLMSSISRAVTVYDRAESSKKEETRKKYEDEWDNRIKFEALGNLGYIPFYKDIRRIMLKNMFKDKKKK
jgi:hypothetical protein